MNNARKPGMAPRGLAAAIVLAVAVLLLLVGAIAVWRAVDPLTRQQAADRLARESVVTEATPLVLDVAIAVAWRALPIGAAVVGLAIAWRRLADRQVLSDHYTAKIRHAETQRYPASVTTLSVHESARAPALPDLSQLLELRPEDVTPQLVAPPPRGLAEIVARGLGSAEQLYIGQGEDGQPQTIRVKHAGFIAIAGVQGMGKSNTAALLAAQVAAAGGMIYVIDPDAGDEESLTNRLAPMSGKIARIAKSPAETNALIAATARIFQHRDQHPGRLYAPFLLLIDEFMRLVVSEQLSEESQRTLLLLSGDGRKKHMLVVPIAQVWKQRLTGPLGTAIRDASTHAIVHASKPGAAELLLPGGYYAQQAATLRPGEALLVGGGGEPTKTTVPELAPADLVYAAAGRPPQPYAPWPDAWLQPGAPDSPAPSAPTERVAPHRPIAIPTAPMVYTVQEQICDLLAARPWSTSSQIAGAIGVDVQVVRTELASLKNARRVVSRQATGETGDRLEWSAAQPLNRSTVVVSA